MKIANVFLLLLFFGCKNAHEKNQEVNRKVHTSIGKAMLDTLGTHKLPYRKWKDFKRDTLNYLINNFVDRNEYYKNKPLSVVFGDLEIPIVDYTTDFSYPPNHKYLHGLTFMFEKYIVVYDKFQAKKVPNLLVVQLKGSLTAEEVRSFLIKYKKPWSKEAKVFYDKQVVKDIGIIKYNKKKATDTLMLQ